ncbi:MAG: 2,3-bisphosphoglycerate-independent phosphoglycerate mutase [Thermoproteales archaeon]|nr:2,3-bisphosphoglycerate-independent phosphoglycerate mutase [Thermoproteales archaeon]
MKFIYLVLDGAADSLKDKVTSYEKANTPNLDKIAKMGKCGMMYTIGKGIAPESDAAVFSILGYDPHKSYTGRGPIEALGAGLEIKEGYEIAFRANFATVEDKSLKLLDRRVGRSLLSEEARELAKAIDNLDLEKYDGYARVVATIGHRAVVVIGSRSHKLSDNVGNTDPAYEKMGKISVAKKEYQKIISECKPLDDSIEAKVTAELVNIFTRKVIGILDEHEVNKKRAFEGKLKANAILMRDGGGSLPKVEKIYERFGLSFGAIAEMPVEIGIARLLGMDIERVPPPTENKEKDYALRLDATFRVLEKMDAVYVHLKGPDEPGHDGNIDRKVKAIELIDKYYVKPLLEMVDLDDTAILVTSDHATPPSLKAHSGDPVPVVLYVPGIEGDMVSKISEKECLKGSLGIIEHGWLLLPKVVEYLNK